MHDWAGLFTISILPDFNYISSLSNNIYPVFACTIYGVSISHLLRDAKACSSDGY